MVTCCGSTDLSPSRASDAGASGALAATDGGVPSVGLGGASAAAPGCDGENVFAIWGKPYNAEQDCLDVDHPLADLACTVKPSEGDPDFNYSDGNACLERLADGARFWVFSLFRLGFDATVWRRCANEPPIAPKGCYAAGCTEAPRSTCTLGQTRLHYDCSTTGEYDENCCGRQPCESGDECGAGEQCVSVPSAGQWYCWDSAAGCDCGGPFGGPPKMVCMPPEPELGEEEALPEAGCEGCKRRPIGDPQWEITQALPIVGDVGALETGPEAYFDWVLKFFGPRHAYSSSEQAFLPGQPHDGPYASELEVLAEAAKLVPAQQLTEAQFSPPSGLVLLVMIVPGAAAPSGSSPDFESAPILPNELFPISATGGVYKQGKPYDLNFGDKILGYDALSQPIDVEGASHFFLSFAENSSFGPPDETPSGVYEFALRATDRHGTGWELTVPFAVGP
jgi:hypothetical protein